MRISDIYGVESVTDFIFYCKIYDNEYCDFSGIRDSGDRRRETSIRYDFTYSYILPAFRLTSLLLKITLMKLGVQ